MTDIASTPSVHGINELEFFREATLRICGSLDIEEALVDLFEYVRHVVPADRVILGHFDREASVVFRVARADRSGGVLDGTELPVPASFGERVASAGEVNVVLVNRASAHWVGELLPLRRLGLGESMLVGRLFVRGEFLGVVVFTADEPDVFDETHVRLISHLTQPCAIALSNSLRYRQINRLKEALAEDYRSLQLDMRQQSGTEIVGADFGLKHVMESVRQVARLDSPVLLLGPTGSGKEVVANVLHSLSVRRLGPMVKVNCGAIPEGLMDSELFGHERGAFTGALTRLRGRFERADKGTIFLDEVGELSAGAQVRLLRVLQEKEIERVGGTKPIRVDIRVIAATHRDLQVMVEEGAFREDLYYRLRVFPIDIPPLKERIEDIPALVHHFLQLRARHIGYSMVPELAPGAMSRLLAHDWPGNVRELQNAVESALIRSGGSPLTFAALAATPTPEVEEQPAQESSEEIALLDEVVARHIRAALKATQGRVGGAAGAALLLGVHPQTLRARMRKLGIAFGRDATKQYS